MFLGLQHAAVEALKNGKEWFASLNKIYSERKLVAYQILDTLGCTYTKDQSGLFVWAKIANDVSNVETRIDEILYATKVFITPGFIFGETGNRYIRISLCSSVEALQEALTRIKVFVELGSNVLNAKVQ
jgi:aspartate/methionine/tyrosine aminotransferase